MSYEVPGDRYYHQATHLWVKPEGDSLRCGFDPLGSETCGDLVAVSFVPVGQAVERGRPFGSLEAAKFVGPLIAPVSGRVQAVNTTVLAAPGRVNEDPLGTWLIEIHCDDLPGELRPLLHDPEAVRRWMERDVVRYRQEGILAQ